MKEEVSQNDKEIARGVRESLREKGMSTKELAKQLGHAPSRVQDQIEGRTHWTRPVKQKYVVALGLDTEGRADKTEKSVWERREALTDEDLDSLLRRDLSYQSRF